VEFVGKMIFRNIFHRKFQFFPTFFFFGGGGEIYVPFYPEICPEKMFEKSAPGVNLMNQFWAKLILKIEIFVSDNIPFRIEEAKRRPKVRWKLFESGLS
jgi:hypothetical protein